MTDPLVNWLVIGVCGLGVFAFLIMTMDWPPVTVEDNGPGVEEQDPLEEEEEE